MSDNKKQNKTRKIDAPWYHRLRWKIECALGYFIYWLANRLSRKAALKLAYGLGSLAYKMFRKYRRVCIDTLTIAFGDKYSMEEKQALALASQRSLCRTIMDFLRFKSYSKDELLELTAEVTGYEHLEAVHAKSKGGILGLTGHIGSWEYCGAWVTSMGWPLVAVGKDQRDPGITKLIIDLRASVGIKHISKGKSGNMDLIRTLKAKNKILGLLIDQNGGKDGIFIDFFGTQASSVSGPASLAIRYKVPVIPIFALWVGDKYRIEILPEVEVIRTGDIEKDILTNTQNFQKIIERVVTKYPEQWLWAHRRWKTRPAGEPPIHLN